MLPRGWFCIALLSALAGCDSGGGGSGSWKLRPNTVEIFAGGTSTGHFTVNDADRDGDRIALLRLDASIQYATIFLSDDRGKTWRAIFVPKAIQSELGGNSFQVGVFLSRGRVYLALSGNLNGSMVPSWNLFDIDLVTGEPTRIVAEDSESGWFVERRPDGHMGYMVPNAGAPFHMDLDPATGQFTRTVLACGAACDVQTFRSVDGGNTWDGFTRFTKGGGVCQVHYDVATTSLTTTCLPRGFIAEDTSTLPVITFRDTTPYLAWSPVVHQAYATTVVPGTPVTESETLRLGPGLIDARFRFGNFERPRYADFDLLVGPSYGVGHLAKLTAAGAQWADLRITPCVVDDGCGYEGVPEYGYGQVQWVLPTGEGDYFVFYTIVTEGVNGSEAMYMTRESPPLVPVVGDEPPPPVTLAPLPAGTQPMNALEKACVVWTGCETFDAFFNYQRCLQTWTTDVAHRPGLAVARTRFIAAATSCAALDSVATSGCPLDCTASGGSCAGGTCSTEVPYVQSSCGTCDVNGKYQLCSWDTTPTPRMFAVACGNGTTCSSGFGCVLTGTNACDAYVQACSNDTLRNCSQPAQLLTQTSCDLEGAVCSDVGTPKCAPSSSQGACDSSQFGYRMQCANADELVACAYGQYRFVGCSSLGYDGCYSVQGGARCQ